MAWIFATSDQNPKPIPAFLCVGRLSHVFPLPSSSPSSSSSSSSCRSKGVSRGKSQSTEATSQTDYSASGHHCIPKHSLTSLSKSTSQVSAH
ncbi:hypothetical protein E2C01_068074 [Portunus trituberculatus]|uniref:Uncharacterized protein n=1 Tax=Portunus trituberculatus TaxID=210409 RepID=A0A5B7HWX6_PORTR|nr:hypothetical protein [Portunus trituberculatus]